MAISTRTNDTNDDHATKIILDALSKNPAKVQALTSEKTQIFNGFEMKEETTQLSGAATTIQREDSINNHDEEFEDELDIGELRRVDNSSRELWNQEKELAWIKRVLPQLPEQDRIKVVKGLIQVAENGPVAWGMFSNGIITLSDIAAEGTTYHEAFHAVFNLMLNESEKSSLFNEARQIFGDKSLLELEEDMAEGFREYIVSQESRGLGRKILDFFKNLFAKATNWKYIKPSLTSYYRMINQGKYKSYTLAQSPVSRLREEQYTSEMQSIRDKAIADGTFMKAPNGNSTNLNERQWLQVRTKSFKNWFGDWINNPSEASKVVDENGEPLVVYHGSPNTFTKFDISRFSESSDIGFRGVGFYFGDRKTAEKYAKGTEPMSVFLNIRRPVDDMIKADTPYLQDMYRFVFGSNSKKELLDRMDYMIENADRYDLSRDEYIALKEEIDSNITDTIIKEVNKGDGVIVYKRSGALDEIVVNNSNQIKSAASNVGSFSTTNDDIRYRAIPNSSWVATDNETRQSLEAEGWTQEKFDSISQVERDQAVKCLGL